MSAPSPPSSSDMSNCLTIATSSSLRPVTVLLLVGLVSSFPPDVNGQEAVIPTEGETIRYELRNRDGRPSRRVRATFRDYRGSDLLVALEAQSIKVPLADIRGLQVARGTRDVRWLGFLLGGVAGCGVGIAVSTTSGTEDPDVNRVVGCAAGAALGMLGGYLVGSILQEPRWIDVDIDLFGRRGTSESSMRVGVSIPAG